ncbi:MAG: GatB/YqeY domain-containing protein, partial [Terriglobales bacterium]
MGLSEQIQKDITEAMKARQELRLSCLRMVKAALKNREIEKRGPLDDAESQQVLATLIKQRRDSVEQFTKAGRPELVEKETAEIGVIESYLPKAAGEAEILAVVRATLAEVGSASGSPPGMKDMGAAMRNV